jgi:hypothetical protein
MHWERKLRGQITACARSSHAHCRNDADVSRADEDAILVDE